VTYGLPLLILADLNLFDRFDLALHAIYLSLLWVLLAVAGVRKFRWLGDNDTLFFVLV
jgi:hypothetical protein